MCDFAQSFYLTQEVDQPTSGSEVLDLIWSSNPDLVSSVLAEDYTGFSDNIVVTSSTTFKLGSEPERKRSLLLQRGERMSRLDFSKAHGLT